MIFAGLDVDYNDYVAVTLENSRMPNEYTIIGEIVSYAHAGEYRQIKVAIKDRPSPLLINERRVKRIAFIEETIPLLINI